MGRGPSGSSTRSWSSGRGARKPRSRRETPSARSPRERFSQTRSPSAVRATRVARGYSGPREAWSFPSRTARSTPRPLMTSAKVPSPSARPQRISPPAERAGLFRNRGASLQSGLRARSLRSRWIRSRGALHRGLRGSFRPLQGGAGSRCPRDVRLGDKPPPAFRSR